MEQHTVTPKELSDMAASLRRLEDRAGELNFASYFPASTFTPRKQEAAAMKLGRELMQFVEAADAAGKTALSARAIESAKMMRRMMERARNQMPRRRTKGRA